MPQVIPPVPQDVDFDEDVVKQWMEEVRRQINTPNFYSQSTDPGTTGVPNGTWSVWKNTTSGLVKVWANDGGVMKSVTLT
jgi:hypothetical protein